MPQPFIRQRLLPAIVLAALCAGSASAQSTDKAQTTDAAQPAPHADHAVSSPGPDASSAIHPLLTKGEVTRWNASTGKVTIRHDEIKNVGMPPMTMVFTLQNPAEGAALKPGDKVLFHAEEANGVLTITHIEPARR